MPADEVVPVPCPVERPRVLSGEYELVAGAAAGEEALGVVALAVDPTVQQAVRQVDLQK